MSVQSCNECKKPDALWNTSNRIWQKIAGEKEGILCPSCFDKKASEMGLVLWWECSLGGYPSKSAHQADIAQAVKDERERIIKKVDELPELGGVLAGTIERTTVLAILGIKHTQNC